jgi:hypothetical protein
MKDTPERKQIAKMLQDNREEIEELRINGFTN